MQNHVTKYNIRKENKSLNIAQFKQVTSLR